MFEKEVEELIQKNIKLNKTPRETVYEAVEFGYNKASEWHKPSEKLPEECSLVLAYAFDDTEPSFWKFVASDQWEWLPERVVFCNNGQIRLWKEIVPPKESK